MRILLFIAMCLTFTGCQTTRTFNHGRDAVFDAAVASVPDTVGRMRLTASDHTNGTFDGLMIDGFGNVYLHGRVIPGSGAKATLTTVQVDCWVWFLLPGDARWAEQQFMQAITKRLSQLH